ncbi:hypothetical protein AWB76_00921 [Caballeronia temeraria]|uniref:Uncharacterized protein n=1 Tax=Caballeronia temeraria TaxID=1777137 RepID=A0A157ZLX3_9BURK|nr:hypothetical protein [Caballeronia temeraria]SAK46481.1 hypothetical protein AWB76_00921 [Caballeronia temeraria]
MYYDSNSQQWFNSEHDYLVYKAANGPESSGMNTLLHEVRELKAMVQQLLNAFGGAQ